MAISSQTILASWIVADGEAVGSVHDLLFGARDWRVRYLAVQTVGWLHGRRVPLPAVLARRADWLNHELSVAVTRRQIEESEWVDASASIPRADQIELARHYGCDASWIDGEGDAGELRSLVEAIGVAVEARDGRAGSVEDFIVDDSFRGARAWELRYLVVEVGNWLRRKRVLVAPASAERIDWEGRKISLRQSLQEIQESPDFDPGEPVNPEAETRLYDYYGLPKSWREKD